MPLRDHFRSPLDDRRHWEGFHGQWPGEIVRGLRDQLPSCYFAEPCILSDNLPREYETRIFDRKQDCRLVAAIEIVSPANKDRPEHRRAFVTKCAALLQNRVSVVMIDVVTTRTSNLYQGLLEVIGQKDEAWDASAPPLYAVACRVTKKDPVWLLETWTEALTIGQALPTLPLWLADDFAIPLELEPSYEETCRSLRIP